MIANAVPSIWISFQVFAILFILLAATSMTFWVLVRRWESHRQITALEDWGSEHGFKLRPAESPELPPPLDSLASRQLAVRTRLASKSTTLIRFQTASPVQSDGIPSATAPVQWRLLIRRLGSSWHPTGLRPAHAHSSALDLFSLSSFPGLGSSERFVIFGTDSTAAKAISESMIRSLLPPDIGLLLHGDQLLLDFSDRPFDEIEFNRMIALADQISEKLPGDH